MVVLATDYSGLAKIAYVVIGFFSLLNAGLFLMFYSMARPRGLPRPFPQRLTLAALAFTFIGPVGFLEGHRLCGMAFNGGNALDQLVMAGVPAIVGSLLLTPFLRRDFRTGVAWLAPVWGIVPTLALVAIMPDASTGRTIDTFSPFLWSIPWHLTCAVLFMTAGRRAWNKELQSKSSCPTCGYSRQGLTTPICPECGGTAMFMASAPPAVRNASPATSASPDNPDAGGTGQSPVGPTPRG